MRRIHRLRRLPRVPPRDLPDLAVALVVSLAVEVGLRRTPLPVLARRLGVDLDQEPDDSLVAWRASTVTDQRRLRNARRVLRRGPAGDTCLRQALLLGQRLRHHAPRLHVGVARVDGAVKAHAWLSLQGARLDPLRSAHRYLPLQAPHGGPE